MHPNDPTPTTADPETAPDNADEAVGSGAEGGKPSSEQQKATLLQSWWQDQFGQQPVLDLGLGTALILLGALVGVFITRRLMIPVVEQLCGRTKTEYDNILFNKKFLGRLSWLGGTAVLTYGPGLIWGNSHPRLGAALSTCGNVVAIVCIAAAIGVGLDAVNTLYQRRPSAKQRPIKGYIQIVAILVYLGAGILAIASLLGQDPMVFLTGLGALTAILMLVFKDTILGLVASIQLTKYDMLRVGDWISMPAVGADGDVTDIALHTIKVQNFDKTITTIPTHQLITGSFQNWRGMQEAGGRRIKRSLAIDMNTVRFLDEDDIDRFGRFELLTDYIAEKRRIIEEHNRQHPTDDNHIANARRLTNIGTFRAWVIAYLRQNDRLHQQGLTFLVRQLPPSESGLPIEIYCFTTTTAWAEYENIQADIFDHLLAMLPEFGLRPYQKPSGADIAANMIADTAT